MRSKLHQTEEVIAETAGTFNAKTQSRKEKALNLCVLATLR